MIILIVLFGIPVFAEEESEGISIEEYVEQFERAWSECKSSADYTYLWVENSQINKEFMDAFLDYRGFENLGEWKDYIYSVEDVQEYESVDFSQHRNSIVPVEDCTTGLPDCKFSIFWL